MLPFSASETNALTNDGNAAVRALLRAPNGSWVDLTDLWGRNWLRAVSYSQSVDETIGQASVSLVKSERFLTLGPLATDSRAAEEYTSNGLALIRQGAEVEVQVSLNDGPRRPVGYYMVLSWGVSAETIDLECGDFIPSFLQRTFLERDLELGAVGGRPMETALEAIIINSGNGRLWQPTSFTAGRYTMSLNPPGHVFVALNSGTNGSTEPTWPTTPGATVTSGTVTYQHVAYVGGINAPIPSGAMIEKGTVAPIGPAWDAMVNVSEMIGWELRQKWTGAGWGLYLEAPARDSEMDSWVWALGPSSYKSLEGINQNVEDVRNVIRIDYMDDLRVNDEGEPTPYAVTGQDIDSISKYGRRFMSVAFDNAGIIRTQPEAERLRDAALADLATPTVGLTLVSGYLPHLELGDIVLVQADGEDITSDYAASVVGLEHTVGPMDEEGSAELETVLKLRLGPPTLGSQRWADRSVGPGLGAGVPDVISPPTNVSAVPNGPTGALVSWNPPTDRDTKGRSRYASAEIHVSTSPSFTPSSGTLKGSAVKAPFLVNGLPVGVTHYVRVVAVDYVRGRSEPSAEVTVVPAGVSGADLEPGSIPTKALLTNPTENLIPNGWSEAGAAAVGADPEGNNLFGPHSPGWNPSIAMTGEYCRAIALEAGVNWHYWTDFLPVTPGERLQHRVWIRGSASYSAGQISLRWSDAARSELSVSSVSTAGINTSWQEFVVTGEAPPNASFVRVTWTTGSVSGADIGKTVYLDCASARRAIVGDLIVGNTVASSNFASGTVTAGDVSSGATNMPAGSIYATAGARIDSVPPSPGQPEKPLIVAPNGLAVGKYTLGDAFFRALNGIDGSDLNTVDGVFWRGNTTSVAGRGMSPDIERLTVTYNASYEYPGATPQVHGWQLSIVPTHVNQNLDGLRYIRIQPYRIVGNRSSLGTGPVFVGIGAQQAWLANYYMPLVSRGYALASNREAIQTFVLHRNIGGNGDVNGSAQRVCLLIRMHNQYGYSATRWFYPPVSGTEWVQTDRPMIPDGGGGSNPGGGDGGLCVDLDTKILLAEGKEKAARDLELGDLVLVPDGGSANPLSGDYVGYAVTYLETSHAEDRLTLTSEAGHSITVTRGHRFFLASDGSEIPVEDCRPGMELVRQPGGMPVVVASITEAPPGEVMLITVTGPACYYSNGLLSHNAKPR